MGYVAHELAPCVLGQPERGYVLEGEKDAAARVGGDGGGDGMEEPSLM